jgi:probable phosphoglycerate mutase
MQKKEANGTQLFGDNKPPKSSFTTEPEVGEWAYGAYEGMLTKDIRQKQPGWEIWKDG